MNEKHIKESYVARIWLEQGVNSDPLWRGHIRHVQGEESLYFRDFMEVSEFMERVSGVPGPDLTMKSKNAALIKDTRSFTNKSPSGK